MTDAPTTTTADVLSGMDLRGRTILVTGGTTGLGFETVRALATAGAEVITTARSEAKGFDACARITELVPAADVSFEICELSSLESVRAFTDRFTAAHDRLDVLIANAGIMATPNDRTAEGFDLQFGTNHLGHFVLIGRLLPLLLSSAPSRIVLLSSGGHSGSDIIWDDPNFDSTEFSKFAAYGQSKTANILHAVELDRRYGPRGLHAWAVHPGMVATDLGRNFTREDYADLVARARSAGAELPPRVGPEVGASTQVWAAVSDEVLERTGTYLADCAFAEAQPYALDPSSAVRLWALSEEMVGESFPER